MNATASAEKKSVFPLRLIMLYALVVGVFPTICVWSEFGNLEATEEDWDPILVLSVLVSVPLLLACWIGIRNFKRLPIITAVISLFTAFHLWSTFSELDMLHGLMGEPYSDPGMSAQAFEDDFRFLFTCSLPFVVIYLLWRFWPRKEVEGLPVH